MIQQLKISESDIHFLKSLGDTLTGFIARDEVARMYVIPVKESDKVVLDRIDGDKEA